MDFEIPTHRFVRHYLERRPPVQLSLRRIDPLIRELTHYRNASYGSAAWRRRSSRASWRRRRPGWPRSPSSPRSFPTSSPSAQIGCSSGASSTRSFASPTKTLEGFDFDFNKKMNRRLVFELAAGQFIDRRKDALFLGPPGTGKSPLAQAIGPAVIRRGHRVLYRETHALFEELADTTIDGSRKDKITELQTVPLLIIDDLGMRKLPDTAAEGPPRDRHAWSPASEHPYNRPVEDWGKLLGDTPAVAAMLDRMLHHGDVLKCGPRSWRTKDAPLNTEQENS